MRLGVKPTSSSSVFDSWVEGAPLTNKMIEELELELISSEKEEEEEEGCIWLFEMTPPLPISRRLLG